MALWKEAEEEYEQRLKSKAHRRDTGVNPFTEEQLGSTQHDIDALRAKKMQPSVCTGDLSGSTRPMMADGERNNPSDRNERRPDSEYAWQLDGARPRLDSLPMLTEAQLREDGNMNRPFRFICRTALSSTQRVALHASNVLLRRLQLSKTPHDSLRAFEERHPSLLFVRNQGSVALYGVYAQWGVVCLFSPHWQVLFYAYVASNDLRG